MTGLHAALTAICDRNQRTLAPHPGMRLDVSVMELRRLLAAHPAEPAPVATRPTNADRLLAAIRMAWHEGDGIPVEDSVKLAQELITNPQPAPVASPERVAEVLRQHILFTVDEGSSEEACRCGWKPTGNPVLSFSEHARHKADALLAAGVFRATCDDCGNPAPGVRHGVADPDPGGESASVICLWHCGHSVPIAPTQCDCVPVDTSGAPY